MIHKYFEDYKVGDLTITEPFTITDEIIAAYLKIVRDDHAIHNDKAYCLKEFGRADLVVPGMLTLAFADSLWAKLVTPSKPYSPHYGQDKVRYLAPLFGGESVRCEYKIVDMSPRNDTYGMITFETYVKKLDGTAVIFETDKILVPYKEPRK